MELEKQIESALAAVINGTVFSVTPAVRAFLVDDSPDATDEEKVYPVLRLLCGTAVAYKTGDILYSAEVACMVATNLVDDAKRQTLSSIYGTAKAAMTAENINAELPDWIKCVEADPMDGAPDLEGNEQQQNFVLKVWFAADEPI